MDSDEEEKEDNMQCSQATAPYQIDPRINESQASLYSSSRYSIVNLPRSANIKVEVKGPFRK
jgi:hypothetical protein